MIKTIKEEIDNYIRRIVEAKPEMSIIPSDTNCVSIQVKTNKWAMESHAHALDMSKDEMNSHFKNVRTVVDFVLDDIYMRGHKCKAVGLRVKIFDKDYLIFDYQVDNKDKALDIVKTFLCIQKFG